MFSLWAGPFGVLLEGMWVGWAGSAAVLFWGVKNVKIKKGMGWKTMCVRFVCDLDKRRCMRLLCISKASGYAARLTTYSRLRYGGNPFSSSYSSFFMFRFCDLVFPSMSGIRRHGQDSSKLCREEVEVEEGDAEAREREKIIDSISVRFEPQTARPFSPSPLRPLDTS